MALPVPSISAVLGKSTQSIESVAIHLENLMHYCDPDSYEIMKRFLTDHTALLRTCSEEQMYQLRVQIKRVSHLIMEQIFYKLEHGCNAHLTIVNGKNQTYSLQHIKFSSKYGKLQYTSTHSNSTSRNETTTTQVALDMFEHIEIGTPLHVDRDIITKNLSLAHKDLTEDFSFTLYCGNSSKNEQGAPEVEKLILSFASESDFAAWYDGIQVKIRDVISLSSVELSSYSLYQIYAVLAINHGIVSIEKELLNFQLDIPPLPPGPEHYTVESKKPIVARSREDRRLSCWIDDLRDGDNDEDEGGLDLDAVVDAKLSELRRNPKIDQKSLSISSVDTETFRKNLRGNDSSSKKDKEKKLGWARASTSGIRKKSVFLSGDV